MPNYWTLILRPLVLYLTLLELNKSKTLENHLFFEAVQFWGDCPLSPLWERQTTSCLIQKTYLAKSVCSTQVIIEESSLFLFRGPKTCFFTNLTPDKIWVISPSHSKNMPVLVKIAILQALSFFILEYKLYENCCAFNLGV